MGEHRNRGPSAVEGADFDPSMPVIVSNGEGGRFHRLDGPGFVTACKTAFVNPTEQVTVTEARSRGFEPCEKPGCFGNGAR